MFKSSYGLFSNDNNGLTDTRNNDENLSTNYSTASADDNCSNSLPKSIVLLVILMIHVTMNEFDNNGNYQKLFSALIFDFSM
jgi:hypothetical protein